MPTIIAGRAAAEEKYHAIKSPAGWSIRRNGVVNSDAEVAFFDKAEWKQSEIDIVLELLNKRGR